MAEMIGKRIVCDRCCDERFLQYIKTTAFDGGYTRVNEFEPVPEGWTYFHEPVGGHLCPECSSRYKDMVRTFMNEHIYVGTESTSTEGPGLVCVKATSLAESIAGEYSR